MSARLIPYVWLLLVWLTWANSSHAQVVAVTLRLETNIVSRGSTTYLHVAAQILPAQRDAADRIFSWYLDVRNANGQVAVADYAQLVKPAADNDPQISSAGFTDGSDRRGIYDTFMNLPGAGKSNPVELLVVPITGLAPGQTTFTVRTGSGVPGLFADFIVAPMGGGDPWLGGDYSAASVTLTVIDPIFDATIDSIHATSLGGGTNRVELRFTAPAGADCYVECRDSLAGQTGWKSIPGGPFAGGLAVDTTAARTRFYRLRIGPAPPDPNPNPTVDSIRAVNLSGGVKQFELRFTPPSGYNCYVEYCDALGSSALWQTLPGAPHNSGVVTDATSNSMRFYQIRIVAIQ